MTDKQLCPDFELRGQTYEIWADPNNPSNRCLVIDTDHAFQPLLTNDELLSIYDYGKGF